jgi:hypothetical protein
MKFSGTGGGIRITSSGGGGGGGSPPMTMLGAWWRADDAGAVDGASVTNWTDRSIYSQSLATLGGVSAPTWQSSVAAIGNRPAVQFEVGTGLQVTSPAGIIGGNQAVTIYIVCQVDTFTNSSIFFYGPTSLTVFGSCMSILDLNGPNRVGTSIYGASGMFPSDANPQILSIRAGNSAAWGTSVLTINGATVAASVDNVGLVLNVPSPVQIACVGGDVSPASFNFDGRIAEIIYYSKDHDASEHNQTLSYLSDRYGISVA